MKSRLQRLEIVIHKKMSPTQEKLTADYIDKLAAYFEGSETAEAVEESFRRIQENKGVRR